jgi:hypothetical protein
MSGSGAALATGSRGPDPSLDQDDPRDSGESRDFGAEYRDSREEGKNEKILTPSRENLAPPLVRSDFVSEKSNMDVSVP